MGAVKITPLQERQIREARLKGAGYRAIANVVGLDRDTVRYYCKKHSLAVQTGKETDRDSGASTLKCPNCSQPVKQQSRGRHRKFCSEACRRKWWSSHQAAIQRRETALYPKTCAYCGKDFVSYGDVHRRYCCHACYIRDRFWKQEDGRTEDAHMGADLS